MKSKGKWSRTTHNNYLIIYKTGNKESKYGVAFILVSGIAHNLERSEYIIERMIFITLKMERRRINLVQVYALHKGRSQHSR